MGCAVLNQGGLRNLIEGNAIPPYLYAYPPRSAYRELPGISITDIWREDHAHALNRNLHLYIHVPFCRYKCGYCNLYTVTSDDADLHTRYVDALVAQLDAHAAIIQERDLKTIYFGGGTPSVLGEAHFAKIFAKIKQIYPNWQSVVEEVCVEATPQSIHSTEFVRSMMALGFTRFNMGVQSLIGDELKLIGRASDGLSVIARAVRSMKEAGLPNFSTDLIIGLEQQTDESWRASVDHMLGYRPDTLSTYFLTIRPDAWLINTGKHSYMRDPKLYQRYDYAREKLLGAGYAQETNIRYMLPGKGGYLQKRGHFRGESYLGIGLGARSYNMTCDYLTGSTTVGSVPITERFIKEVAEGVPQVTLAYRFSDEERIRKRFVLGMIDLNVGELEKYNYAEHRHKFEPIVDACQALGLLQRCGGKYQLTELGMRHRDVVSWAFVSDEVAELDKAFYGSLHETMSKRKVGFVGTQDLLSAARRAAP